MRRPVSPEPQAHSQRLGAVTLALLVLACDRGGVREARTSAPTAPPSASAAPAANLGTASARPSTGERWPARAAGGDAFTVGIIEHRPPPHEVARLTDVRAARHEGFDRVVFELGSGAPPGYHVEYIDRPVRKCGSGETTEIAGDGWLEVRLEPTDAHTPSGSPTIANRNQAVGLEVVKELEQTCDFEAQVTWVLGVQKPNPYRVLTLNDPLRLVVDVRH
jgi:hypothetical protein